MLACRLSLSEAVRVVRDTAGCAPSSVRRGVSQNGNKKKCGRSRTLIHCFSSLESILSLTILVWIGTHVRRSKLSQTGPSFVSPFVCKTEHIEHQASPT